jgi:hypothetical protein
MEVSDVLVSLQSGLAGEPESLRRLGVSISETRIATRLLGKGIVQTKAEITDAMKATERYNIIIEDTAKAQGDFKRTSESLANQTRTLNAQMDDLRATLGGIVAGPASAFTGFLLSIVDTTPDVTSRVAAITKSMKEMEKQTEAVVEAAKDLDDAWEPLRRSDIGLFGVRVSPLADELIEVANAARLSRDELNDAIRLTDTTPESLRQLMTALRDVRNEYDPLSSATYIYTQNVEGATEALDGMEKAEQRATRQAKRLTDALEGVASKGFGSVQSEAKQAQQAIREAARTNAWGLLRKERERLEQQRAKFAKQGGEADVLAVIDARLDQIAVEIKQRRIVSRHYRDETKENRDREKAQGERKSTIEDLAKTHEVSERKVSAVMKRHRGNIDKTTAALKKFGEQKAEPKAGLDTSEFDRKLRKATADLRAFGALVSRPTASSIRMGETKHLASGGPVRAGQSYIVGERRPELFVPTQNGTILPRVPAGMSGAVNVYVKPEIVVAAATIERQTARAQRLNRVRANT